MENLSKLYVCKFGGSSVATVESFKKVKEIVSSDPKRRIVITSAIGKGKKEDNKITDLLYLLHAHVEYGVNYDNILELIKSRYVVIKEGLNLKIDIEREIDKIISVIKANSIDFLVSRGEYLTALMLSEYLGYEFVDAKDLIKFDYNGKVDFDKTEEKVNAILKDKKKVVIPGFYGSYPNGDIKLFSRGGSDISGSIIARSVKADCYENFTDVDGFYMASPKIVDKPMMIKEITFDELRELSYMGASVIHEDAIFPIQDLNIPLHILNTFNPKNPGTIINNNVTSTNNIITGLAGKKGFMALNVIKNKNSSKIDVINTVLNTLKKYHVSIESIPTSIDSFSVVSSETELSKCMYDILAELKNDPDIEKVSIDSDISLIAVVGRNMVFKPGISAKIFSVLGSNKINIKLISQNTKELSIIIGVENKDFEKAIKAIYDGVVTK